MEEGTRKKRLYPYGVMSSGLIMLLVVCSLLLSSCGSTPPDHPFGTSPNTTDNLNSPTSTSGAKVKPISVIDAQTSTSTYPGGYMTLAIATSPFAICHFVVSYGMSTQSKSVGIIPRTADGNGVASWRWQVDRGAHSGSWPMTISATLPSGAQTTKQISVYVSLAPITVVSSVLTASPGGDMTLTVATAPGIRCTLLLDFGSGLPSRTLTRGAGSDGIVTWSWKVDRGASAGVFPSTVTAILADGESSYAQVDMTIL